MMSGESPTYKDPPVQKILRKRHCVDHRITELTHYSDRYAEL
jgi:hypothetical protein